MGVGRLTVEPTPLAARALARSAYLWVYPLVVNYGRMFAETTGSRLPSGGKRVGPLLQQRMAATLESEPKLAVEAPVAEIPVTESKVAWSVWLDLGEGACLLAVPATDKRWLRVRETADLWGFSVDLDLDSRAMRTLFLRAKQTDDESDVIDQSRAVDQVVRLEPRFVRTEISIRLMEPDDVDEAIACVQQQIGVEAANQRGVRVASAPVPRLHLRPYRRDTEVTRRFWSTANFALSLIEPHRRDRKMLESIREIGLVAGQPWDETRFPPDVIEAIDEGMEDAISELLRAASLGADQPTSDRTSSRAGLDQDYFTRALCAVQHSHVVESSS